MHEHGSRRLAGPEAVPQDRMEGKPEIDPRLLLPADTAKIGEDARNLIANRALEIVSAALDAASRGNHQVMKYLFEEAGIFSAKPAPDQDEGFFCLGMLDACHARHQGHSCDSAEGASSRAASLRAVE